MTIRVHTAPLPPEVAAEIRTRDPRRAPASRGRHELEWLRRFVANPEDIGRFYGLAAGRGAGDESEAPFLGFLPTTFPSTDGPPVEYVIITDSTAVDGRPVGDLVAEFQRLADWKTRKGTPAVVRTVSWIRAHYAGHDDAARIRTFLIDAYEQWGTDFVLLGGDVRIVPDRRFNGLALGSGHPPADVYYGGLDHSWDLDRDGIFGEFFQDVGASDPYWDVWVGRAPVEDRAEAAIFVDRSLAYARAPGSDLAGLDPDYPTRLLLLEGLGNCAFWGQGCNGIYVGETILRRLAPPGFESQRVYQQLLDPNPFCAYHETYLQVHDAPQTPWTTQSAFAAVNNGAGFIHHFEHSNPYEEGGASGGFGCAVTSGGALGREYIDLLTNKPNWSIMYSTGAGVNAFDYESVSEHWVLNPNGGAAAYVGKTRSGSIANTTGEVDTLFFGHLFQDAMTVGEAMAMATQGVSLSPTQSVASFALLGDPELDPWTATPSPIAITLSPPAAVLGEQAITATVRHAVTLAPIAGARVSLFESDRLYARGITGSDGSARFAVTLTRPASGDGHGHRQEPGAGHQRPAGGIRRAGSRRVSQPCRARRFAGGRQRQRHPRCRRGLEGRCDGREPGLAAGGRRRRRARRRGGGHARRRVGRSLCSRAPLRRRLLPESACRSGRRERLHAPLSRRRVRGRDPARPAGAPHRNERSRPLRVAAGKRVASGGARPGPGRRRPVDRRLPRSGRPPALSGGRPRAGRRCVSRQCRIRLPSISPPRPPAMSTA